MFANIYTTDTQPRTSYSNFDDDDVDNLSDGDVDSLSLLELRRDLTPFRLSGGGADSAASNNGTLTWKAGSHPPPASDTLSTLSSVSSMTLQAGRFDPSDHQILQSIHGQIYHWVYKL